MEDFSKYLKSSRAALKKTQTQLGELLGVSWVSIWRWENGHDAPKDYKIEGIKSIIEREKNND